MDIEVKKEWLKALRSGEYKQGKRFLCKDDKYCCLGVLADIAYDGDWIWHDNHQAYSIDGFTGALTEEFKKVVFPKDLDGGWTSTLIDMNDSGSTFEQIANWIDTNI